MEDSLKLPEVAQRLGVSQQTARRYIKTGRLPSVFIGGAYRVTEEALEAFFRRARVTPEEPSPKGEAPSLPSDTQQDEAATARRLQGIADIVDFYRGGWEEELEGAARYPAGRGAEVYFSAFGLAELANTEIRRAPRGGAQTEAARRAALDAISSLLAFGRRIRAEMDTPSQDEGEAEAEKHGRHLRVLEGGIRDSA